MNNDLSRFGSSPVDHYLQSDIIQQLFGAENSLSFSQLKPDGVENSLFMYHMRKLEDRGIVERSDNGFRLTSVGVRWVNFVGPSTLRPKMLVRTLINFIITDKTGSKLLVSRRLGKAAEILHEYLLPGGLHDYGTTTVEAAVQLLRKRTAIETIPDQIAILEIIHHFPDDFTHHIISFLFHTTSDDPPPETTEYYSYEWINIGEAAQKNTLYGPLIHEIASRFQDKNFKSFETLEFDIK